MNIDMIISAILYGIIVVFLGNLLFEEKLNLKKPISIISVLIYMIFLYYNSMVADKFLKTTIMLICLIFLYKTLYKKDWLQSFNGGVISYIILFAAEFICGLIFTIISMLVNKNILEIIYNTFFLNITIAIIICLIIFLIKKTKKNPLNIISKYQDVNMFVIFAIILLILSITLYKIDKDNWEFSSKVYIDIINFGMFFYVIISLIKQRIRYSKFIKQYVQLADYSVVNDKVLEEYRIKNHEYKNQLAVIKGMVDKDNKELNEYVDNLIKSNKINKYKWITELNYINLLGLKGLLNFKIMECNNLKINTSVTVNKGIIDEKFEQLNSEDKEQLYSIIGVYLDNAKEASVEAKQKRIRIDIHTNKESVIISIANTYKGNIEEEKLDNYKYTTKGKNRGIGLYLVHKIVEKNDKFKIERKITDTYFIQTLNIKK